MNITFSKSIALNFGNGHGRALPGFVLQIRNWFMFVNVAGFQVHRC